MTDESERVIYNQGSVVVTKTLVRVAKESYPINGIGSVLVEDSSRWPLVVCAVILAGLGGVLAAAHSLVGCIFFFGLAVVATLAAMSPHSTLVLRTASGDYRALVSRDPRLLGIIKQAIEQAVALRG